jgi:hypothetical protein
LACDFGRDEVELGALAGAAARLPSRSTAASASDLGCRSEGEDDPVASHRPRPEGLDGGRPQAQLVGAYGWG